MSHQPLDASAALADALAAHKRALAGCRRCPLGPGVVPVISDAPAPRVLLVGQAPGQSEVASRRAFIGRAGRTLFRWLAVSGLDEPEARAAIHFAAMTRCYPGPHPGGRGYRVAVAAERRGARPGSTPSSRCCAAVLVIPVGGWRSTGSSAAARCRRSSAGGTRSSCLAAPRSRCLLPHPSGASSWLNTPAHRALLDEALQVLGVELRRAGLVPAGAGRPRDRERRVTAALAVAAPSPPRRHGPLRARPRRRRASAADARRGGADVGGGPARGAATRRRGLHARGARRGGPGLGADKVKHFSSPGRRIDRLRGGARPAGAAPLGARRGRGAGRRRVRRAPRCRGRRAGAGFSCAT
jgi:uracil-DNA glycosylase